MSRAHDSKIYTQTLGRDGGLSNHPTESPKDQEGCIYNGTRKSMSGVKESWPTELAGSFKNNGVSVRALLETGANQHLIEHVILIGQCGRKLSPTLGLRN